MKLSEAKALLSSAGIDSAAYDAAELFSHFCGYTRAALAAEDVSSDDPALLAAIARRCAREPLQYIIGRVFFYNEVYRVTPDCLIPRADTERLVELALQHLPKNSHFADFCTGSGCIAISTLANRKDLTATAVDISEAALTLAKENAKTNGVAERITFRQADLLSAPALGRFDAILCNPPYIRTRDVAVLAPELAHEPSIALDGGEDGLLFYKHLLSTYPDTFFLFEIGYDQGNDLLSLAKRHGRTAEVFKDYGGNDRVVSIK